MTERLFIHDPRAKARDAAAQLYPKIDGLQGKTMVVLNNHWTCMDEMIDHLGALLGVAQGSVRPPRLAIMKWNGGKAGTISHQPVALSAQYYFTGSQAFRPFLGLGWHHSNVDREHTTGALDGTRLGIETGEGPMGTIGMDFLVGERWFARADARYLRWRSDVAVDGANVGEAKVDPWLVGLSVGARF